ncbi:Rrf2 family transcriptional regulator [Maritimibacter sp. UBA3975]|uniref:RrF2 family transcriptional regulator n=1 Tax=Maritimibacter sp. UBA3975 TaxID=1946833 RepID=UPI000C0AC045|nr:Rrf2 family transcriptional regulator [Maritimibacter sp. UBA3975]MAM62642.1 transcriptional regulator [Maritimibacter sp.]|tara:strand:- start:24059 stop:24484 length:426 start_codon:yes stop_codon:yes gene_type:complete
MRTDNRLSRVLHALLHLQDLDGPATSEQIGMMLNTNAAVVRRTMGGLREAGFVASVKGHGGGWTLARPLDQITLLALYDALGEPSLFAVGRSEDAPGCQLEQAANAALSSALDAARARFRQELSEVTVADLRDRTAPGFSV